MPRPSSLAPLAERPSTQRPLRSVEDSVRSRLASAEQRPCLLGAFAALRPCDVARQRAGDGSRRLRAGKSRLGIVGSDVKSAPLLSAAQREFVDADEAPPRPCCEGRLQLLVFAFLSASVVLGALWRGW